MPALWIGILPGRQGRTLASLPRKGLPDAGGRQWNESLGDGIPGEGMDTEGQNRGKRATRGKHAGYGGFSFADSLPTGAAVAYIGQEMVKWGEVSSNEIMAILRRRNVLVDFAFLRSSPGRG
jgi:hypothetical protein